MSARPDAPQPTDPWRSEVTDMYDRKRERVDQARRECDEQHDRYDRGEISYEEYMGAIDLYTATIRGAYG